MAVTPFRHIDFVNHEPVTKEKLDQFQSNVQWVVDNTPVTLHVNDSLQASITSLIIVGGRLNMYMYGEWTWGRVFFDGAFDASSNPVVTLGVGSENFQRIYSTISGIDTATLPDSRGFDVSLALQQDGVNNYRGKGEPVYVNWMAIGKRSPNYDSF